MAVPGFRGWILTLGSGNSRLWGRDLVPVGSRGLSSGAGEGDSTMEGFGWEGTTKPSQFPPHGQGQLPCGRLGREGPAQGAAGPGCPCCAPGIPAGTPSPCGQSHSQGTAGQMSPVLSALMACVPCSCRAGTCSVLSLCALCENCRFPMMINLCSLPTFLFCHRL